MLEALLAFVHISAVLALVVFASAEAALCRREWMNAAVVERLVRIDSIAIAAAIAVLLTGFARAWWGAKGWDWYMDNPLMHLKLVLFALVVALSTRPTRVLRRWRLALRASGDLPAEDELRAARRSIMIQTHLIAVIPLAAVFMARGYGA